jgi:hypothetical protein
LAFYLCGLGPHAPCNGLRALDVFAVLADGKGEIDDIVTAEEPGRMIGQLKSLALGLLAVGVSEARALRIVHRCATSSMPQTRSASSVQNAAYV